jgi:hypothetical protein
MLDRYFITITPLFDFHSTPYRITTFNFTIQAATRIIFQSVIISLAATLPYSVQRLRYARVNPQFESRQGLQIFFVLQIVQTGSGAHPTSNSIANVVVPRNKMARM